MVILRAIHSLAGQVGPGLSPRLNIRLAGDMATRSGFKHRRGAATTTAFDVAAILIALDAIVGLMAILGRSI